MRAQGGDVGLMRTTPDGTTFRLALRTPGPELRRRAPADTQGA